MKLKYLNKSKFITNHENVKYFIYIWYIYHHAQVKIHMYKSFLIASPVKVAPAFHRTNIFLT